MTRITLACPEAVFADYVHLRRCLMPTAAEADTPPDPVFAWRDDTGAIFSVSSVAVSAEWLDRAQAILVAPAWGADMAAAQRAQARIVLWTGEGAVPRATVATITVIPDLPGGAAPAGMGLSPAETDVLI